MHIAKVIVHDVDGVTRRRADRSLIDSVVDAASFKLREDFSEESRLGINSQHARA